MDGEGGFTCGWNTLCHMNLPRVISKKSPKGRDFPKTSDPTLGAMLTFILGKSSPLGPPPKESHLQTLHHWFQVVWDTIWTLVSSQSLKLHTIYSCYIRTKTTSLVECSNVNSNH